MLRKEFQGVLKQSLFFLAVVVGISFVIKIVLPDAGSYLEVFYLMYQFLLVWFGAFMGISLFLSDKRQRAEDYVFSLPYSRLRLLGIKVLPRLTAVVIIYLIFLGFYLEGVEGLLLGETFFTISWLYWFVFVLTLSFSASGDSYMKVGGIALLGTIIFLQLFYFSVQLASLLKGVRPQSLPWGILGLLTINFSNILVPFLVVCVCLLLPYIISFVFTYKKWGTYLKENFNKGFFKLFLPLIAVGFILSTLYVYTLIRDIYYEYYLTSKHQLIETKYFSTRLVEADGDLKLKFSQSVFFVFFEDEQYVYGTQMRHTSDSIVRIHKENHRVETLQKEITPDNRMGRYRHRIRVFKHIIVVPVHYANPLLRAFVFIDTRSKATKKMRTADVMPPDYIEPIIFGADTDVASGKIFWLISYIRSHQFPIIKLWEDGKTENLGIMSRTFPVYCSRMLVTTTDDALVLRRITGNGLEVLREITRYKQLKFPTSSTYGRVNLNPTSLKDIYCFQRKKNSGRDYFRLNLETLEISPVFKIPEKQNQWIHIDAGEVYNIHFEWDEKEIDARKRRYYMNKIDRLEGEKFTLLKEFPAYENPQEGDRFWISKNGVVIKYNNKLSIYTFPDMKQLEFQGIR